MVIEVVDDGRGGAEVGGRGRAEVGGRGGPEGDGRSGAEATGRSVAEANGSSGADAGGRSWAEAGGLGGAGVRGRDRAGVRTQGGAGVRGRDGAGVSRRDGAEAGGRSGGAAATGWTGAEAGGRNGAEAGGRGGAEVRGWGAAEAGSRGQGLIGMRERVALYGGELRGGAGACGRMGGPGETGHRRVIRVLIADDQALLRGSFKVLLDLTPDISVVGEAGTGAEAVALARGEQPDVVLMDVRMPQMDGIEATRLICDATRTPYTRVLILTTFDLDEYVYAALRAGASGFLLKDVRPDDLVAAIRVVAAGDGLLAPTVTARLIAEFAARPAGGPPAVRLDGVTDRERQVLTLVARGLSNAEIGDHLRLTMATVKTHVGRLLGKLQARDRAQLVIAAYETGLVQPRHKGAG